jgi:hypothetical protein
VDGGRWCGVYVCISLVCVLCVCVYLGVCWVVCRVVVGVCGLCGRCGRTDRHMCDMCVCVYVWVKKWCVCISFCGLLVGLVVRLV